MVDLQPGYYPLMPLRDVVVFPGMVSPLIVGRQGSIWALEEAMETGSLVFLLTQREAGVDEPQEGDLYSVGVLAKVMQLLRLPDGTVKALIEGKRCGRVTEMSEAENFSVVKIEEMPCLGLDEPGLASYVNELKKGFAQYVAINKNLSSELLAKVEVSNDPEWLVNFIASHLQVKTVDKQKILELNIITEKITKVLEFIFQEIELHELEKKIHARVKKKMAVAQRNYYLSEKVKVIQEEMGKNEGGGNELSLLEDSIKSKGLPEAVQDKLEKELNKLRQMSPMSAEATVVRTYIDTVLALPWNERTESEIDIIKAEKILDEDHYGLKKPKERILEYLAVQAQVKKVKGPVLCLVGPPGVGKTSICKSIARAMGREFARLSLGGVRDEADIRGHRRTYIGAMVGKIISGMQKCGVVNPLFCLDEVDKMSMDFRGDPSSALLEVLDPEQNNSFNDHYLDLDYDLSEVFFITTANTLHGIPLPLLDRMEIIQLTGYTEEEKKKIALDFLVPRQLEYSGFLEGDIQFSDGAVLEIIRRYTREAGVRSLERNIAAVCRKIARKRLHKKDKKKYRVSCQSVVSYLGIPKYRYGQAEERSEIGLATGMAWTETGGELLQIEATIMPGSGKMTVTGKLGEVMQESVQAAWSYVRSRSMRLGLEPDFYKSLDVHIHVPEGAIPKDGPSAGITIATCIVSAILKKPVDCSLAMTGEITLRGRVLPIGGLTEKLLAAKRGNITRVMIPEDNEKDLLEVPQKIRNSLQVDIVGSMDDVLEKALLLQEGESLFQDVSFESVYGDFTLSSHNVISRQ